MGQQRKDWAAELARQYIEATLKVPVETWDRDARQGAHDLRYDHEGRSIAVEVKLVVDADYRALEKRIAKTGYMRDSRLTRMWDLRLKHRARVDQALRDVPDLLMHLEQRGWQDRRLWELRKSDPVTAASLERLGVTSLWSQRPTLKHPPGFYLMPEPWGSWEQGIESLPAFVSDLLAEPQGGRSVGSSPTHRLMSVMPSCFSGGNTWSPCCCIRVTPASFRRLRPSSQNRSMDYGLQASRRRHEFSPGFLIVGGLKVAGGLRI